MEQQSFNSELDLVLISATIILSNPADFSPSPTSLSPNIDCYGIPVPRVWTVQRVENNNWSLSLHISTFIACLALALQQRPSSFYIQPVSHIEELQSILAHSFLYNVETSQSLNFLSPHSTLATGTPACHRLLGNLGSFIPELVTIEHRSFSPHTDLLGLDLATSSPALQELAQNLAFMSADIRHHFLVVFNLDTSIFIQSSETINPIQNGLIIGSQPYSFPPSIFSETAELFDFQNDPLSLHSFIPRPHISPASGNNLSIAPFPALQVSIPIAQSSPITSVGDLFNAYSINWTTTKIDVMMSPKSSGRKPISLVYLVNMVYKISAILEQMHLPSFRDDPTAKADGVLKPILISVGALFGLKNL
ncbi:hypothetical protein BDZ89DRAFT_1141231 [Hymenopellis radicata]|nr:hypothetical protein BDZ89DRAFT_1141231 [Hymenopellis radicata]